MACAQLRATVDEASFSAADSVDGCTDYQLNLTRGELERLVGEPTVAHLWGLRSIAKSEPRIVVIADTGEVREEQS